jgi:glycosyltransferase involved in cell wall biosynthesis
MILSPLQSDIIAVVNSNARKVTVLLATYNGVSFLDEQLTSLSEQQNVNIEVLVNDDGSSDGTMEILWKWRDRGLIVSISESTGLGSTSAFLKLLQDCDDKPYVAFCDQDDIWIPNKLTKQLELCEANTPTLVFSRRKSFNQSGKCLGRAPSLKKNIAFENALIENIVPGNTILLNNPAIKKINSYFFPDITHYDSWIYLLISAFGKCKFINEPLVLYRIHENNQVGLRKFDINRFESSALDYLQQAEYLSKHSKWDLSEKNQETLANFLSVLQIKSKVGKTKAILKTNFSREHLIDKVGFKIIFLKLVCKKKI